MEIKQQWKGDELVEFYAIQHCMEVIEEILREYFPQFGITVIRPDNSSYITIKLSKSNPYVTEMIRVLILLDREDAFLTGTKNVVTIVRPSITDIRTSIIGEIGIINQFDVSYLLQRINEAVPRTPELWGEVN